VTNQSCLTKYINEDIMNHVIAHTIDDIDPDSPFADALLADGFEDAFVGFGMQFTAAVAIYDYERCLTILQIRDEMSWDEASEYFEYNVVGAYVGAHTPVFMQWLTGYGPGLLKTTAPVIDQF
jgi:hypothetical protein